MQINKKSNVREYTYEILLGVFYNGELLSESINKCFSENDFSDKDKAYVKNECVGIVERCDELDIIINEHLNNKNKRLDKELQIVLRIGAYELLYLDKVPTFATINECVNIIKHTRMKPLSGFVNAVLRNIYRSICNNVRRKNVNAKNFKRCYFRVYNNNELLVTKELSNKNIVYKPYDGGFNFKYARVYYAYNYKDIINTECFKNGYIFISDASSIYLTDKIADFIKSRKKSNKEVSIKVLDTCASPGGKVLGLIDFIQSDFDEIYAEARDISDNKLNRIIENMDRLKVFNLKTFVKDASSYDETDCEKYDVVICDVPCTGLGVLNKKPDIKLHYSEEKLKSLVPLQKKILDTSSKYVKAGGILSYSTCTTTQDENEEVTKYFLNSNDNFCKLYEKRIEINDENKSDGFYMCILEKRII